MMIQINLDRQLESTLCNEMNASYCQRRDGARYNAESDEAEVCSYLGTYFPRSWAEHTIIWRQLLQYETVKAAFREKPVIRILDVGSGTGGHSFAVIEQLRRNFRRSRIEILAIDANERALAKQQELHECLMYNGVTIKPVPCFFELSPDGFANKLLEKCQGNHGGFDIILTSKFLSELGGYADKQQKKASGFYRSFLSVADKLLISDGILSLVDVNISIKNKHVAEYMRGEIHAAFNESLNLAVLMPSHCGYFLSQCRNNATCYMTIPIEIAHRLQPRTDISKICFRVLARKSFTTRIFSEMQPIPETIKVNDQGFCRLGSAGRGSVGVDFMDCFR